MNKQSKGITGEGLSNLAARFFPALRKSEHSAPATPTCSHCKEATAGKLYTSGDASICSGCLSFYHRLDNPYTNHQLEKLQEAGEEVQLLTPSLIEAMLDRRIVGNAAVKKALAVAGSLHLLRIKNPGHSFKKDNILIIGDSGTGKTEIVGSVARFIGVPFTKADSTGITENGWRGDDPVSILTDLLVAADGDVKRAEMGIAFIDEFDKKASAGTSREDSGKGAQQSCLTIFEEGIVEVPVRRNMPEHQRKTVRMNTKNILFITAGAFVGIDEVAERLRHKASGRGQIKIAPEDDEEIKRPKKDLSNISSSALIEYGLIKEIVGRFPVVLQMDPHTEDSLLRVLTEIDDSLLDEYKNMVALSGRCALEIDEPALKAIVRKALERGGSGARDLRAIMAKVMEPVFYALPDKTNVKSVTITEAVVEGREEAIYEEGDPEENGKIAVSDRRRVALETLEP